MFLKRTARVANSVDPAQTDLGLYYFLKHLRPNINGDYSNTFWFVTFQISFILFQVQTMRELEASTLVMNMLMKDWN